MDNEILYLREAKTDAYVMTTYKGKKLKTDIVKYYKDKSKNHNIEWWSQEIWVPAQYPVIEKNV